jgi:hypothetical protein
MLFEVLLVSPREFIEEGGQCCAFRNLFVPIEGFGEALIFVWSDLRRKDEGFPYNTMLGARGFPTIQC